MNEQNGWRIWSWQEFRPHWEELETWARRHREWGSVESLWPSFRAIFQGVSTAVAQHDPALFVEAIQTIERTHDQDLPDLVRSFYHVANAWTDREVLGPMMACQVRLLLKQVLDSRDMLALDFEQGRRQLASWLGCVALRFEDRDSWVSAQTRARRERRAEEKHAREREKRRAQTVRELAALKMRTAT